MGNGVSCLNPSGRQLLSSANTGNAAAVRNVSPLVLQHLVTCTLAYLPVCTVRTHRLQHLQAALSADKCDISGEMPVFHRQAIAQERYRERSWQHTREVLTISCVAGVGGQA